mgnify:CR=1 FL=1
MNIPNNLKYTKDHEWILIKSENEIICGITDYAQKESDRRSKCTAPLFNKGAYQYVGNLEDAKFAGR